MRRRYIEATKELKKDLKSGKEAILASGGTFDMEGLENHVENLLLYRRDGTFEACDEGKLAEANPSQWTMTMKHVMSL